MRPVHFLSHFLFRRPANPVHIWKPEYIVLAIIIDQFKQVNDINLVNAIKSLLDYALQKENDTFSIPETHQKLVMDRFGKVQKNPEDLLDWDEAKKTLKA